MYDKLLQDYNQALEIYDQENIYFPEDIKNRVGRIKKEAQ